MRSKVHETEIDTGLHDTVHMPYFVATRLVSQVRISNAKVVDTTGITDLNKDFFEGQHQGVPSHKTFTSKERHFDVNPSDLSKIWKIGLGNATKTLKATTQTML